MEYFRSVIALERSHSTQKCDHDNDHINNADDNHNNNHNESLLRKTKSKPRICRRLRHNVFTSPSSILNTDTNASNSDIHNNSNSNSNSNSNHNHSLHKHQQQPHHLYQNASLSTTPKLYSYSSQVLNLPYRVSSRGSSHQRYGHYSEPIVEMKIAGTEDDIHNMDFSKFAESSASNLLLMSTRTTTAGADGTTTTTSSSTAVLIPADDDNHNHNYNHTEFGGGHCPFAMDVNDESDATSVRTAPPALASPSPNTTVTSSGSSISFGLRLTLDPTTVSAVDHELNRSAAVTVGYLGAGYVECDGHGDADVDAADVDVDADANAGEDNVNVNAGMGLVAVDALLTPASSTSCLFLNLSLSNLHDVPLELKVEDDDQNQMGLLQMDMSQLQMSIIRQVTDPAAEADDALRTPAAYDIILDAMDANTKLKVETLSASSFESQHYRKMGDCGNGAFGVVSKEFHLPSCKVVAIKSSLASDTTAVKQFKKEIAIFHQLRDNPFIVNMIDCGFDADLNQMRIALEFMDLASLTSAGTAGAYSVSAVKHIGYSVLSALSALHALLYVHNDVKPDNILVNHRLEVKLCDFGCVKKMADAHTPLADAVGSLKYRSHEQRFITPIAYTTKTDIYSLGITLYELLSGGGAHANKANNNDNGDCSEVVEMYYEPPQLLSTEEHAFDAHTIDFVSKCLDTDYKSRWNATQLLSHPFFEDYGNYTHSDSQTDDGNCNHNCNNNCSNSFSFFEALSTCATTTLNENKMDLEFMIESLIAYYTSYSDPNLLPLKSTPIDFLFSDKERIQAMASHTGYPLQNIRNCIRQCISSHSRHYLSSTRSKSSGRSTNYEI